MDLQQTKGESKSDFCKDPIDGLHTESYLFSTIFRHTGVTDELRIMEIFGVGMRVALPKSRYRSPL